MAESTPSTKIGFGAKDNLPLVLENKGLDAFDLVCFDNREFGWIDKQGQPVISTPRTQTAITVNGVDGLGVEDGYEIPAGKSFDEIIKMLVQKAIPATYTKPTLSLSAPLAKTYEVGEVITDTLTATFSQKDSAGMTAISISDPEGNVIVSSNSSQTIASDPLTITIKNGSLTYTANASYDAAVIKQDNLGNDSPDNAFSAGSLSQTKTYKGAWKAFYGCGAGDITATSANIRALSDSVLGPVKGKTSFEIKLQKGDQWAMFAFPSNLNTVPTVKYVETNDSNCADNFTYSTLSVDGANGVTGTGYNAYLFKMASPADAAMTFEVSF